MCQNRCEQSKSEINSSPPSAAYMRRWTGSSLVQIMAPSHYLLLSIGLMGTNFSEIWIGILPFSVKKTNLKCRLPKWRPFCSGKDELRHVCILLQCPTYALPLESSRSQFVLQLIVWCHERMILDIKILNTHGFTHVTSVSLQGDDETKSPSTSEKVI